MAVVPKAAALGEMADGANAAPAPVLAPWTGSGDAAASLRVKVLRKRDAFVRPDLPLSPSCGRGRARERPRLDQ